MTDQDVRAAGAAAAATLLGAAALTPVYTSPAWLAPVVAVILVVLAGGLLFRAVGAAAWARLTRGRALPDQWRTLGAGLVPVGQVALLLCVLTALFAPARAGWGVVPTRASVRQLAAVFADIGGSVTELDDGLAITPTELHGGPWRVFEDHRMATAGAIVGLAVDGIEVDDIGSTAKTLPQFAELWHGMLATSRATAEPAGQQPG